MYQGAATRSTPAADPLRRSGAGARAPGARTSARARLAPLGERHLDRVEVARDVRVARTTARASSRSSRAGVAAREVRQREQPDLGLARELGRLARRCCARSRARARPPPRRTSPRARARRRSCAATRERLARRGVAGDHDLAARPRSGPITCSGAHAVDGLAALQAPEVGPGRDAELLGELGVEAARARVLDERVAEGAAPRWRTGNARDHVAVALDASRRARARRSSARRAGARRRPRIASHQLAQCRAARRRSAARRGRAGRTTSASPAARASGRRGSA